jgi:hypothetical protein
MPRYIYYTASDKNILRAQQEEQNVAFVICFQMHIITSVGLQMSPPGV